MPERIAIVYLGRLGDILNALPIAYELYRQGHEVTWYAMEEFSAPLKCAPYVRFVPFKSDVKSPLLAYKAAMGDDPVRMQYDRILCLQIDGNPFPLKQKTSSWATDVYKHVGMTELYTTLPLVLKEPDWMGLDFWPDVPINAIAVCVNAYTSPHPAPKQLAEWLGKEFTTIQTDAIRLDDPMRLCQLLRKVKCLVTIDTFPMHLAYFTGTPTIAITAQGWIGSVPRMHWIERVDYASSTTEAGREKIRRAIKLAIDGRVSPGMVLRNGGDPPANESPMAPLAGGNQNTPGSGKILSILVPTIASRKKWLDRFLEGMQPQVMENADLVELLIESDDGEMSIGAKRNKLISRAAGEWVVFHDDDDPPQPYYVKSILSEIQKHAPDCIGFKVGRAMTIDGKMTRCGEGTYSLKHMCDSERRRGNTQFSPGWTEYEKTPRHLNPMRASIARKIPFIEEGPQGDRGEDVDFAKRLKDSGLLQSERFIDRELYVYELRTDAERDGEKTHAARINGK